MSTSPRVTSLPFIFPTPPPIEQAVQRQAEIWLEANAKMAAAAAITTNSSPNQNNPGGRPRKEDKVPRPSNIFMLFRAEFRKLEEIRQLGIDTRELSRHASLVWQQIGEEEKAKWKPLAQALKKKHSEMFPSYKYQVRSSFAEATREASSGTVMAASGSFSKPAKKRSGRKATRVREVSTSSYTSSTPTSSPLTWDPGNNLELPYAFCTLPAISEHDGASITTDMSPALAPAATYDDCGYEVESQALFEPSPFFVALAASGPEAILRFLDEEADVLAGLRPPPTTAEY